MHPLFLTKINSNMLGGLIQTMISCSERLFFVFAKPNRGSGCLTSYKMAPMINKKFFHREAD